MHLYPYNCNKVYAIQLLLNLDQNHQMNWLYQHLSMCPPIGFPINSCKPASKQTSKSNPASTTGSAFTVRLTTSVVKQLPEPKLYVKSYVPAAVRLYNPVGVIPFPLHIPFAGNPVN